MTDLEVLHAMGVGQCAEFRAADTLEFVRVRSFAYDSEGASVRDEA